FQKEDRRKRIYKITPQGSSLLNELDTETRDNLFIMNLFMSIESDINLWDLYEQSRQLDQEATQEVNEKGRSSYIDTILKNIGSVVMYSAMKNMESKDFENQPKLNLLPQVIASRLKTIGFKPDYIRNVFKNRSDQGRFDNLDAYYQMSREITPENYKELMIFYQALQGMDTVHIVTKK
ncbi:MAG: hypothetical protein Q7J35_12790, partial [Candidatus Methanoperedens sp.]|nr:hypothetical protein [Candidatus Methanoperedens sp.]